MTRRSYVNADWVVMAWAWALVLVVVIPTWADPDLWGHLRFGLDSLSTRSLPSVDPYSFTQDRPWVNHEWLSEAVMAAAYQYGGVSGLVALKFVLAGLALMTLAGALAPLPVLDLLAAGASREEILEDYPYLEKEDLDAVLSFAARQNDHPVLRSA